MAAPTSLSVPQCAVRPMTGPPAGARTAASLAAPCGMGPSRSQPMSAELAGLRELGPAPGSNRPGPTDFAALPDALHESIASCLEPGDFARLATTSHDLHQTLQPKAARHRMLVQHVPQVRDPVCIGIVLEAAEPLKDSPALMVAPLALMVQELAGTPPHLRGPGCRELLRAIEALPARNRGEPLLSMATQVALLPAVEREAAFETVLRLAAPVAPDALAAVLEALAGGVRSLPAEARPRGFRRLLNVAMEHLPGRVAALLAPLIAQLPRAARPAAFHALSQSAAKLPPREHEAAQTLLARHLADLPVDARSAAAAGLLRPAG